MCVSVLDFILGLKSTSKRGSMYVISFRDTDVDVSSAIHFLAACRNYNQHSATRGREACRENLFQGC